MTGLCWFVLLQPGGSKLSPELSELVVYTCSVPFKGFEQAAERPATEMSSFSESKALKLIKDSGTTCSPIRPAVTWLFIGTVRCRAKSSKVVLGSVELCWCALPLQEFTLSVTTVTS